MSKYFIVDIVESGRSYFDDQKNKMTLNKQEYLEFIQSAMEEGTLHAIMKSFTFTCGNCKSFTIPSRALYQSIANAFDFDGLQGIAWHLIERIPLTDEEWSTYLEYGQQQVDSLKGKDIIKIVTDNEELYKFIAEEVFFRFDKTCNCSNLIFQ